MKMRPLQDRILVKRILGKDKTDGGLHIPDTAKEKPLEGIVISVGNGKMLDTGKQRPLDVAVGDHILFAKYAGTEVRVDDEDRLMLREEDILGVLEDD